MAIIVFWINIISSQESSVTGAVYDRENGLPLNEVYVTVIGDSTGVYTGDSGQFELHVGRPGFTEISFNKEGYGTHKTRVSVEGKPTQVGDVFLSYLGSPWEVSLPLQENELYDEESGWGDRVLLQAGRDVFLNRAAFDFGQVYFRLRGYDSAENEVLFNGFPVNSLMTGRAEWSLWGGLNDVTRNQHISYGLQASPETPGGMLGSSTIVTAPSDMRMGSRISSSLSNRTYAGRLMLTHVGGDSGKGLSYALSASGRWAGRGYIAGTSYDAYSMFSSLVYQWTYHRLLLTALLAYNQRGRSAAITPEVMNLTGRDYNPYWGLQDGKIRNARIRKLREPICQIQHVYKKGRFYLRSGLAYQWGERSNSRLGYFNAPNPDPTYYRKLPSFYLNSPSAPNLISAYQSERAFTAAPQFSWESLYLANQNPFLQGKSAYLLSADVVRSQLWSAYIRGEWDISGFRLSWGWPWRKLQARHGSELRDLLGSEYHLDMDPFSATLNDMEGNARKTKGDIFGYDYTLHIQKSRPYLQLQYHKPGISAFISGSYELTSLQREGHFQNERYPENSVGKGESIRFSAVGIKAGVRYGINGKHWLDVNAGSFEKAPLPINTYINPRDHHLAVPGPVVEKNRGLEINYHLRSPSWIGRFTGYYTRFRNRSDVNFFYADTGLGSDFIQEVVSGIDYLHKGLELGLEHELGADLSISLVMALGDFRYSRDPEVRLYFDNSGEEEEQINSEGTAYLGYADLEQYFRSSGPQTAVSLGFNYRHPDYWWIAVNADYLSGAYPSLSTLARTPQFSLDPETGVPNPAAGDAELRRMLRQQSIPSVYLLNLTGGRSWRLKQYYLSFFLSLSNLFDSTYATGGYEQGRNANFGQWLKDHRSGRPSFGTKFWYGRGRSYFLNLAISF
ncbi:TonB-dependent receptor [Zeaxanthinibacter sp. PT1]|uniref:TonB-dependent receptor n=1 Tax=Zeaxanthinibacter TaxID=561554 RepID=UPI00234BDE27|nr:TonB-dependent receptor [Zeaxanthinibacter sp. PT1]MDC6351017.1 TonB-dependent receptor [Zeaxanthinibacter sp. PT1]